MTLDTYRASTGRILYPLALTLNKRGISANQLSALSLLCAVIAGLAFYVQLLPLAVVAVGLNAFFDALDGCVARSSNCESSKGDLVDHVIDRYADIFIFGGIIFGGYVPWQIGLIALLGILMTSYLGTQAQAIGAGRDYRGLIGRADRLLLVFIVAILNAIYPAPIIWFPLLGWMMLVLAVASNFTALQRFYLAYKEL
ncbi:MAG: CDP-alcohol phosphatidyltransferase family protein [Euryarchaeota archaeon]|nr:CDP-alcohol phosphatidyltransferase family protein [Euryarchaeota archaeon]